MNSSLRAVLAFLSLAVFAACSGDKSQQANSAEHEGLTYAGGVHAIIEKNCTSCHRSGGIAPFVLEGYEDVAAMGAVIADSVESGRMPPWQPEPGCGNFDGARSLDSSAVQALSQWVADGMVEGSAPAKAEETGDHEARGVLDETTADLLLDAGEDYVPDPSRPDDYRCFILNHDFSEDTFITGSSVLPDRDELVHHVLLFLVPPKDHDDLAALDENDAGLGYTCFGTPGVGAGITLGGWAPGGQPTKIRSGAAIVVPGGSKVVMQVHYNLANIEIGADLPGDRTQVAFWLQEKGTTPEFEIRITPLANGSIEVPAHEAASKHILDFPVPTDTTIVGVTPHMHLLGKSIKVELIREGEENQCMVHIPQWDFAWQQFYTYADDSWVEAKKGDKLRLTCTYDNSQENQPVVNGIQQETRDVFWGDGSHDEMCLNYISTIRPYVPEKEDQLLCADFGACVEICEADDAFCFFNCSLVQGLDCVECSFPALVLCGFTVCQSESKDFYGCLETCEDIDGAPDCLMRTCAEQYGDFYQCMRPHLLEGACNEGLTECGVPATEKARDL